MNARGVNILPIIGFIILILVLFTGLILFRNDDSNTGGSTGMFEGIMSKAKTIGGYIVDENGELSAQGKDKISVDVASADVNIYTHDEDSVKAHLHGEVKTTSEDIVPYLELKEDGHTIVVRIQSPQVTNHFFPYYSADLRLDVTIPESWMNTLEIGTTSGDISAQKLTGSDIVLKSSSGDTEIQSITGENITAETVSGKIRIKMINGENGFFKSSSGDLSIDEVNFSGKFEANTVSGDFSINRLECKEGKFDASSGDIELKEIIAGKIKSEAVSGTIKVKMVNGSAELKTSSGDINAEFEKNFESIKAQSASGDICLTIPSDSEFALDAKTVSGVIKCKDFPVSIISSGDRELVGNVGSGRSELKVNTTSGNILIKE